MTPPGAITTATSVSGWTAIPQLKPNVGAPAGLVLSEIVERTPVVRSTPITASVRKSFITMSPLLRARSAGPENSGAPAGLVLRDRRVRAPVAASTLITPPVPPNAL